MSSVRMCDNPNCAEIFSEAEEGWSTSSQIKMVSNPDGSKRTVQVNVDLCPDCSGDVEGLAKRLGESRRARRRERLELESSSSYRIERELDRVEASQPRRAPLRPVTATPEDDEPEDEENEYVASESHKRMTGYPGYTK